MGMLRPLPSPSPAASTTTALQALLAPEYDIIHVAGDVVAGFVGACFFFFFKLKMICLCGLFLLRFIVYIRSVLCVHACACRRPGLRSW